MDGDGGVPVDGVELLPPVTRPGKIICIGLNYRKHAMETNSPIPEVPVVFSKFSNTIAANGELVPLPAVAHQYDYEVELGVAIGKRASHVSEEDALSYVLGYFTANDVSVRDLQFRTNQWLLGKTLDKFLPIGPWLVTADEVGDPRGLRMSLHVNGTEWSSYDTARMEWDFAELVAYLSRGQSILPGQVVTSGSYPGGSALDLGRMLKPGDLVELRIDRLGSLINPVAPA